MRTIISRKAVILLSSILSTLLNAHASEVQSSSFDEVINLKPYMVTGGISSGDPDATILPVSSLEGTALELMRDGNLGTTLEWMPGIQSTAFASGASRPIIRGFDGPRVQILQEGLAVADVSADSPDHAVNIPSDFAHHIDVIRGPATLLYGGSAVGGVINVVGGLFPQLTENMERRVTIRSNYHTASRGWNHQLESSLSQERWAATIAASKTDFGDYDIPGFASSSLELAAHHDHEHEQESEAEDGELTKDRLPQSFLESTWYRAGIRHRFGESFEWAIGISDLSKNYGVPGHSHGHEDEQDAHAEDEGVHEEEELAHDAVSIDMDQQSYDAEIQGRWDTSLIRGLKLRIHASDYHHSELEGDEVATSFDKQLLSGRFKLLHENDGGWSGVSGLQWDRVDYVSEGEEALLPALQNDTFAAFTVQTMDFEALRLHGGARLEKVKYDPDSALTEYDENALSYSGGVQVKLPDNSKMDLVLSQSARHPSATELYADGLHAATRSFEVGDTRLRREIAKGIDFRFVHETADWHIVLSVFANRFDDYLYAKPTGEEQDGFAVYQYSQADADFVGAELELCWKALKRANQYLELSLVADAVRGNLLDASTQLPRIPANRIGWIVMYRLNDWKLRADFRHVFAVNEVVENELPSASYDVLNMSLVHSAQWNQIQLDFSLRLKNLLDEEIRPHTSFLKDLAPQAGRGIEFGITLNL